MHHGPSGGTTQVNHLTAARAMAPATAGMVQVDHFAVACATLRAAQRLARHRPIISQRRVSRCQRRHGAAAGAAQVEHLATAPAAAWHSGRYSGRHSAGRPDGRRKRQAPRRHRRHGATAGTVQADHFAAACVTLRAAERHNGWPGTGLSSRSGVYLGASGGTAQQPERRTPTTTQQHASRRQR